MSAVGAHMLLLPAFLAFFGSYVYSPEVAATTPHSTRDAAAGGRGSPPDEDAIFMQVSSNVLSKLVPSQPTRLAPLLELALNRTAQSAPLPEHAAVSLPQLVPGQLVKSVSMPELAPSRPAGLAPLLEIAPNQRTESVPLPELVARSRPAESASLPDLAPGRPADSVSLLELAPSKSAGTASLPLATPSQSVDSKGAAVAAPPDARTPLAVQRLAAHDEAEATKLTTLDSEGLSFFGLSFFGIVWYWILSPIFVTLGICTCCTISLIAGFLVYEYHTIKKIVTDPSFAKAIAMAIEGSLAKLGILAKLPAEWGGSGPLSAGV